MATKGNFTRKHYLAPYKNEEAAESAKFEHLGNRISTITDDSSDETDSQVFYDSLDGTAEETLLSRTETWTVEGQYDPKDKAHGIIKKAKRSDDEGRKVWHKIEETDGSVVTGLAKIFDPIAGGGEASDKEALSCRIAFIKKPDVKPSGDA